MTIREMTYPSYSTAADTRRVSWQAIFAGAVSCAAIAGCLGALGMALGLLRLSGDTIVVQGIRAGTTVWLVCASCVAFCAGGWIAARSAGTGTVGDSVLHGVIAWATALVGLLLLWEPMGHLFRVMALRLDPTQTVAFGRALFLSSFFGGIASALGGAAGARLYLPMPVEQYERTVKVAGRRHQGAGAEGLSGIGR